MEITEISRRRYMGTVGWGLAAALLIVATAAGIGRATMNLESALTDKPDLAIFLLLPDEEIHTVELLEDLGSERRYQVETTTGPKFVILKKGEVEWYVSTIENLHEGLDSKKDEE